MARKKKGRIPRKLRPWSVHPKSPYLPPCQPLSYRSFVPHSSNLSTENPTSNSWRSFWQHATAPLFYLTFPIYLAHHRHRKPEVCLHPPCFLYCWGPRKFLLAILSHAVYTNLPLFHSTSLLGTHMYRLTGISGNCVQDYPSSETGILLWIVVRASFTLFYSLLRSLIFTLPCVELNDSTAPGWI